MGISVSDIVYAAVAALGITWVVEFFLRRFSAMFARPAIFEYRQGDAEHIVRKCCALFPKDVVRFRGEVYTRGMFVSITAPERKALQGSLVGSDYDNTICLLTGKHIIIHDMSNIYISEVRHPHCG